MNDIPKVTMFLDGQMPDLALPLETCPWTANWSKIGNISGQEIGARSDFAGWVTSPKMQMGLDYPDIVFVILLRPPTELEDWIQSWGRGGRRQINGKDVLVICICLWNHEDIADNVPGISNAVRDFCLNHDDGCLRQMLRDHFPGDTSSISGWCCGPCSGIGKVKGVNST